jgi:hypothetical protein
MKSGMDRDRLAATDEIIAFEMEGAGGVGAISDRGDQGRL